MDLHLPAPVFWYYIYFFPLKKVFCLITNSHIGCLKVLETVAQPLLYFVLDFQHHELYWQFDTIIFDAVSCQGECVLFLMEGVENTSTSHWSLMCSFALVFRLSRSSFMFKQAEMFCGSFKQSLQSWHCINQSQLLVGDSDHYFLCSTTNAACPGRILFLF